MYACCISHGVYKKRAGGDAGYRLQGGVILEMSQRDSVKLNPAEVAGHFFPQPGMQVTQYLVSI